MAKTVLVIPCYDEARRLDAAACLKFLSRAEDIDLLFVDDGSRDDTLRRLEALRAEAPARVRVLPLPRNVGKAEAVRQGVLSALEEGVEYVGYWDADLATPLDDVLAFRAILRERPGLRWVIGSRVQLLGRTIERRAARHYAGRIFATAVSLLLDLRVYDTQCGAKLFRADRQLRDLFAAPFRTRWLFDVELLFRLIASEERARPADLICEVPLHRWRDVPGSRLRPRDFGRAAFELLRLHVGFRARLRAAARRRSAAAAAGTAPAGAASGAAARERPRG